MPARTPRPQGGFTLIELVMVIVLTGVLAAMAIPRLLDLRSDARASAIRQVEGVVRTSADLMHQAWILRGNGNLGNVELAMTDGSRVSFWWGYPDAGACCHTPGTGIEAAVASYGLAVVYVDNARTRWQFATAPTPAACSVTFAEASSASGGYGVTSDTSGC